jgi:hypothetical protein
MGARIKNLSESKSALLPGPGYHDPLPLFKYDGHTKFGKSKRSVIYDEKIAITNPSPL